MNNNTIDARREMFGLLLAQFQLADWTPYGIAVQPVIRFEGRESDASPDPALPYTATFIRPAIAPQATLAGETGARRWETRGTLWTQCFGPLSSGKGLEIAEYQSIIATKAYQGKSSENCIWFRNVRPQYIGPSGGWYQINVLTDYEYDELR